MNALTVIPWPCGRAARWSSCARTLPAHRPHAGSAILLRRPAPRWLVRCSTISETSGMFAVTGIKLIRGHAAEWLPVIAGLLLLYLPTTYDLATGIWKYDEYAHGPIILCVVLWLIWKKREVFAGDFVRSQPAATAPGL